MSSQSPSCVLVLEIQVPEIQIKLISHVILHIPGIKFYYRNRESHTDLPHQQENFSTSTLQLLTFSSPTTTIPHQCKGSEENFCQSFRPWQDSNQERERERERTRLTPTRAMAAVTCEVSDKIDVRLPSRICDPTIVKDPRRTPAQVLSLTSRNFVINQVPCIKPNSMRSCILHRLCSIIRLASEDITLIRSRIVGKQKREENPKQTQMQIPLEHPKSTQLQSLSHHHLCISQSGNSRLNLILSIHRLAIAGKPSRTLTL